MSFIRALAKEAAGLLTDIAMWLFVLAILITVALALWVWFAL